MTIVRRDLQDADVAIAGARWEAAGFSSLQAIEKALKALVRKRTTHVDLNGTSHGALEQLTYGQIERGGDEANEHRLVALTDLIRTWHRSAFDRFRADFARIDGDNLYKGLRYPNSAIGAAAMAFGEGDARWLRRLAEDVVGVVSSRL
jgi:HEPN domain-containing protein